MSWTSYADLARRLDAVRRNHLELTAGQHREVESGRAARVQLVDPLAEQQTELGHAASVLRIRMPLIDPPPSTAVTARDALAQAQTAAELSDQEQVRAVERARAPRFLPAASTVVRNSAVYASCAGVGVLVSMVMQLLIGDTDPTTVMLWALFGLPVVAFFVGYLLIGVVCVPRIPPEPPTHDQHGVPLPPSKRVVPPPRRTPRLGFLICFLTGPLIWLLITLIL